MNIPSYITGAMYVQASRTLRAKVVTCLAGYDLTMTSWSLMGFVSEARNGVRLNEAAHQLSVKAPLITVLVDELVHRDYMQRLPHQLDKRAKLLVVTPAGKTFMKRVETDINARLSELLVGLSESDLMTYQKVLDTIIKNGNS